MGDMFNEASAFDQDLGWCVEYGVDLHAAFDGTRCESTSCGIHHLSFCTAAPTPAPIPYFEGVHTDTSIRAAVALWRSNPYAAEARYGHISTWDTSGVRDMGHLFYGSVVREDEFNEDISAWDTSSVTTFTYMFYYASSFNQPIGGWSIDKVTSMTDMFREAIDFDQDLGWCVGDHVKIQGAFEKTKCESTRCGFSYRDVIGNCERHSRPCLIGTKGQCHINSPTLAFLLANILLALLASVELYVHRRKEEDETYVAAARRLLCDRRCQSEKDPIIVNSWPVSPAESPREEPDEEAAAEKTKAAEPVEPWSFSKKLTSFFFGEQEEPPTEDAPKEEEEAAALPVFAEAEEEATEQPPPPPAGRWFSRAEPEPASAEETFPVAEAEEPTSTEQPPPPAQRWFSEAEPEA